MDLQKPLEVARARGTCPSKANSILDFEPAFRKERIKLTGFLITAGGVRSAFFDGKSNKLGAERSQIRETPPNQNLERNGDFPGRDKVTGRQIDGTVNIVTAQFPWPCAWESFRRRERSRRTAGRRV